MRRTRSDPRVRLALLAAALLAAAAASLALHHGGRRTNLPPAVPSAPQMHGGELRDPLAWAPGRDADLERRAAAGTSRALYLLSPGGAAASAARTARWRPLVERTAHAAGVDPDRLEALVFLESAGRPDALTAAGIRGAAGLTQILAETARDLLGMRVDTAASGRLTRRIERALAARRRRRATALERTRRRVDERFDPVKALAATGRYLLLAKRRFGREDLAFESYHMGIGNLERVVRAYGGGRPSYAQLYFDSTPARRTAAYRLLAGFGDDSSNYYWKLSAAEEIMRLQRRDPATLARVAALQAAAPDARALLHPPGERPGAARRVPVLPPWTGLRRTAPQALQPEALALALYVGAQVRALARSGTLALAPATTGGGWRFAVERRYASRAQALAFQFVLDRLQVLDAIAWSRAGGAIEITVAHDARALEPLLDRLPGAGR